MSRPKLSSPNGEPILLHRERDVPFTVIKVNPKTVAAVLEHVETHIGPCLEGFHETLSRAVHIDVYRFGPAAGRNFQTLVTCGMSDRAMSAPAEALDCRYAELLIHLPPDWPVGLETLEDPVMGWPVQQLESCARFPHSNKTWLWWGHTVAECDPPQPFHSSTDFCGWLVTHSSLLPPEFAHRHGSGRRSIAFFSLVPLYAEEIQFKLDRGVDALLDRFQRAGVDAVVRPGRPNVCREAAH